MTCTRCRRDAPILHTIDEQIRVDAKLKNEDLTTGGLCPACLRAIVPADQLGPYLERSA